jgi:CheY-like chemotaxis protein
MTKASVLVVEDDSAIRELVVDTLVEAGFVLRAVPDGSVALQQLAEWRPDVIVLDLMMPVMDGPTFRAEQRRLALSADVPLVVLSASRQVREIAADLGAVAVLRKPFDINELVSVVRRAIDEA